jgi:hypothetical protein
MGIGNKDVEKSRKNLSHEIGTGEIRIRKEKEKPGKTRNKRK